LAITNKHLEDSMKPLMCLAVACVMLLSGCPDNKMPKTPPKVPEPKAAATGASPLLQPVAATAPHKSAA
jgi:hypothetical protein